MRGVWHFWRFNCHIVKRLWGKQIILIISLVIRGLQLPFRSSFIKEGWKVHLTGGLLKYLKVILWFSYLAQIILSLSVTEEVDQHQNAVDGCMETRQYVVNIYYISSSLWSEHALILPKDIGSWLTLHCAPFRAEKHADINMYLIIFSDTYG